MNTLELLIAARKKIERPECWTQVVSARDEFGNSVLPCSPYAVRWCGYGAACSAWIKPTDQHLSVEISQACHALSTACDSSFPLWQDAPERTHAEVLECFSRAIESERQRAAAASNETGDAA